MEWYNKNTTKKKKKVVNLGKPRKEKYKQTKYRKIEKINSNLVDLNPSTSVITLNVKAQNTFIKR